jgi:formate hydrogenlyase subunit 4
MAYLALAPLAGGLLAGLDRKVSARMQGRVGPPVVQPFYDVAKLLKKEKIAVNPFQNFFIFLFLLFMIFTGAVFFAGANILIVVFVMVLANLFFVLAGFSVNSPYSHLGAERELIQMMAYEPAILILAIGFYVVTGTFNVGGIYQASREGYLFLYLPGIFATYLYVLTIKFRKSPFDLSMSHHAHQEIVRGLTTEFSGPHLALIEIAHWYENVLLLALIYLFFAFSPVIGVAVALIAYFAEVFVDNAFARVKWQVMFASTWVFTIMAGVSNLIIIHYLIGR